MFDSCRFFNSSEPKVLTEKGIIKFKNVLGIIIQHLLDIAITTTITVTSVMVELVVTNDIQQIVWNVFNKLHSHKAKLQTGWKNWYLHIILSVALQITLDLF